MEPYAKTVTPENYARLYRRAARTLDRIHALLDGQQWSPDTLDAIARLLRSAGYEIREPD